MIPSAVFFDMDGTLTDSEPIWFESEKEVMSRFDYTWTVDDQRECIGGPLLKVGRIMSNRVNGENTPEFFVEILVAKVSENFQTKMGYMPGALETLKQVVARGIPTALVTASPKQLADATIRGLPGDYFDLVVSSDDVVNTKPDPECYLKAANYFGVDIANCLILEDSKTGVMSAAASGAKVIAIPHLVQVQATEQVKIIKTLLGMSLDELFALH
ncbi:MAG: HAD family phosphatase [Actinobacteria bacterium]|jgi:HAD superfamily hydrolase (TIGR01509 family)|nr:HAD family phosphatase [Actinomycetota bacterium]